MPPHGGGGTPAEEVIRQDKKMRGTPAKEDLSSVIDKFMKKHPKPPPRPPATFQWDTGGPPMLRHEIPSQRDLNKMHEDEMFRRHNESLQTPSGKWST